MLTTQLIARKRDGGRLEPDAWYAFIRSYVAGDVPDYQMAAMLMAVFLRGLDDGETAALTQAMRTTGAQLSLHDLAPARVDKHSTGGVGDKTSLVLAPLVASLGVMVPMMSGRGLGHTGGTLDKLEAVPGFRTALGLDEARLQLAHIGCALMAQTAEIAPADRRMYALRDATATIESVPLIASSIMSKKLAEDLTGLVLDVKRGSGSFVRDLDHALDLARAMISLGERQGCRVVALLTAMDRPLGRAVGNALEVEEAIHTLHGEGPPDLMAVTFALGAEMLQLAGRARDDNEARQLMQTAIASGAAARKFQDIIEAQGGNPGVVDDPAVLPQAAACELFESPRRGVVASVEPRPVGEGLVALGGGRTRPADVVDPTVGFVITAKPGLWVERGEPIAAIFARDEGGIATGRAALAAAIRIADQAEEPLPLISHRVTVDGVSVLAPAG